jgi:hypothetical protein
MTQPHHLLVWFVPAILPQVQSAGCDLHHSQSALCVKAVKGRLQSTGQPARTRIARSFGGENHVPGQRPIDATIANWIAQQVQTQVTCSPTSMSSGR